jgi:hypothetical protein
MQRVGWSPPGSCGQAETSSNWADGLIISYF